MSSKTMGLIMLVVIGIGAMVTWKLTKPKLDQMAIEDTSAAKDMLGEVRIAQDPWVGYFPLRSQRFRALMRAAKWNPKVEDDGADYHKRMEALSEGKIDFAVVTVDSFVLNAAKYKYPGTITWIIDESKGDDAIVVRKVFADSLNGLRGKTPRVCFTPDSPSHHLLKALRSTFNLPEILPPKSDSRRIETAGSEEALKKLLAGDCDVAGLWEPDVSRALAHDEIIRLFGTDKTEGYIVDIMVVNRDFLKKHPDIVKLVADVYFRTLKYYIVEHPDELRKELMAETKLSAENVEKMIKGVAWVNLTQNCIRWFGIPAADGQTALQLLVDTIQSTIGVLIDAGDFKGNPLPDGDPYKIFYPDVLKDLFLHSVAGLERETAAPVVSSLETKFDALSDERWAALKEIGTLKVEPIKFQSGTSRLSYDGKMSLNDLADKMKHFPTSRLKFMGHTSTEGDQEANTRLSLERAQSCAKYFEVTYGMDPNRLFSVGLGGTKPLVQEPDETERAWNSRLPRVELVLLVDEL